MSRRPRRIVAAVAWALVVGVASVTPAPALGGPGAGAGVPLDVVLHAVGYAVLAWLLVAADTSLLTAVLLAAAFGAGIEVVQSVLPYRAGSLVDAAANLAGALAGGVARRSTRQRRRTADRPGE